MKNNDYDSVVVPIVWLETLLKYALRTEGVMQSLDKLEDMELVSKLKLPELVGFSKSTLTVLEYNKKV